MKTGFKKATGRRAARHSGGFTLAETMIGVGALALFAGACFSGIMFNRVASMKSKEQAIAMDYLIHYVETVKGMQFNDVTGGFPINPLFNGLSGSPNITIPTSAAWVAIDTADFQTFHPDLLWLSNRNPQMQVTLTTQSVGGAPHDKQMNVKVAWDSPLGRGGRLTVQLDLLRTKDL